jgi:TIR domain-containing protein
MKVFISHAHENEALAKKLGKALKRAGWDVWDDEQILPGDNWAEKIGQALEESQAMVVLLTGAALSSSNVRWEIDYALGTKRLKNRLIPVLVGSEENISTKNFPWILSHMKMIKLPESGREEDGIRQITEALQAPA